MDTPEQSPGMDEIRLQINSALLFSLCARDIILIFPVDVHSMRCEKQKGAVEVRV